MTGNANLNEKKPTQKKEYQSLKGGGLFQL